MKKLLIVFALLASNLSNGAVPDTIAEEKPTVLIVPYNRAMHLSDADIDISMGSGMEIPAMRETLRKDLLKALNKNFQDVGDFNQGRHDFVKDDDGSRDVVYHSLLYQSDEVYPLKDPAKFAVKDTVKNKDIKKLKKETNYINVQINDQYLISDLSKKYDADYIIFLNEIDIKTHFDDCLNLALQIYRRDLKVHYSIFDKQGKQVYGDVAVAYFDSNSNDVKEIGEKNFPTISNYILESFKKASN